MQLKYIIYFCQYFIMNYNKFIFFSTFILLASCASKKDVYYFQDIGKSPLQNSFKFLNIQPGDILDIQIKALNPESVTIFQRQYSNINPQIQIQNRVVDGYLVGENGNIKLPIIGSVDTTEETTYSLALEIQKTLSSYIKNPSVNIRLLNFRVSVLGEVNKPGTYTVMEERISIPQALGLAGDLTINGNRNSVLLIRNQDGVKINHIIDLTKSDFLNSDFYFLKQNDIIYVRPNNAKVKSSGFVGSVATVTSVLSLILSLTLVLIR